MRACVRGRRHRPVRGEEIFMADKSPRQSSSKKSGKTLKEKRREKKSSKASRVEPLIPPRRPAR